MTESMAMPEKQAIGQVASAAYVDFDRIMEEAEERAQDRKYAEAALELVNSRLNAAANDLTGIVERLREAGDNPAQLRDAEEVLDQIEPLENALREILSRKRAPRPGDAFAVAAQVSALVGDAEAARDRCPEEDPGPPPPPPRPGRRTWDVVVAHIMAALPHLWSFISRLFTPTQWTVQGNVGTGVFGFAGASISVTFGKSD